MRETNEKSILFRREIERLQELGYKDLALRYLEKEER